MSPLAPFLASYLDLARHLDPLRHPVDAPAETHHRLGRFDPPWLVAQVAALKSIANAIEDLEDVEALDDEVDRTMLLNTIRADLVLLEARALGETADPLLPLAHLHDALYALMGEEFDAAREAALTARLAALPGFLAALRDDRRPVAADLLGRAVGATNQLLEALDEASEHLSDAAVQPGLVAVAEHRAWLEAPGRADGVGRLGPESVERLLATFSPEPLGVKGTLRLLELRRAGVMRSLGAAATALGSDNPFAMVREVMLDGELDLDDYATEWPAECQRVRDAMRDMGLPVLDGPCEEDPIDADDRWSLAVEAVRTHAAEMADAARDVSPRPVRRVLQAPGLVRGWARTTAALLRATAVTDTPERQLMLSFRALVDCAAAEADLLLQAREGTREELERRVGDVTGLEAEACHTILSEVEDAPLEALAAALAHEAWQEWYAEVGGEPVAFLRRALDGGGLAVPLARWALTG